MSSPSNTRPDAVVIGGGVIGLASALAIAERGLRCIVVAASDAGAASGAAAGILAATLHPPRDPRARTLLGASRDLYPALVAQLADRTGCSLSLSRAGVLEAAADATRLDEMARESENGLVPLDRRALADAEPALSHLAGALLHPDDGIVDSVELWRALEIAARSDARITVVAERAASVTWSSGEPTVVTGTSERIAAGTLVVAAGAWVSRIGGLPRTLPVEPVRGQMLALGASPTRRVVFGDGVYLAPRGGRTLVGSTSESVGFDASTTPDAIRRLHDSAIALCPGLAGAPRLAEWAGLRPMTPDMLPVVGRDPEHPSVVYACGHSRNGILLAPLTARCVAALVAGDDPPFDIAPWAPERFARA